MWREHKTLGAMVTAVVTVATLSAACSSSTMIVTRPSGARVYLDGEPVGVTPYVMSDTRIVGSTTVVKLELPGYEPFQAQIARNEQFSVGACIAGVFFLVPFLWIMGYRATHTYELRPVAGGGFQDQGFQPPAGVPPQGGSWGEQPGGASPWGPPVQPAPPPPPPPPPPRR